MILPYLWIIIVGGVVCFLVACGNGANDLANAFGTTYGSRVLTLTQIVILASCFEFLGAAVLGKNVVTTMSSGITTTALFKDDPYVLMYGFLCALGATFIWLLLATWKSLAVSSHHSIAGGIIGFALVYGGTEAVNWAGHSKTFPFVSGVVPIVISWFASPLLSGGVAAAIYFAARFGILQRKNAASFAPYTLPIVVLLTTFLEFLFIFLIAGSSKLNWSSLHAAWVSAVVSVGCATLAIGFVPLLRRRIRQIEAMAYMRAAEEHITVEDAMQLILAGGRPIRLDLERCHPQHSGKDNTDRERTRGTERELNGNFVEMHLNQEAPAVTVIGPLQKNQSNTATALLPVVKSLEGPREATGSVVQADNEPVESSCSDESTESDCTAQPTPQGTIDKKGFPYFDPRAEYMFRYLQVFTAVCTSLAHGANDVSNSIGPFAAIYDIYIHCAVRKTADVPMWLLCLGGAGIIFGLSTYGLNIMHLLGEKIAVITPVRGFSAELATALVVSFATLYGIPVSSTHCITGAVIAIGIADSGIRNVRWSIVLKMYAGWIFTLLVTGVISACFFAQGINSPIKGMMRSPS